LIVSNFFSKRAKNERVIFVFSILSNTRINLIGQLPLSEIFAFFACFSKKYWKGVFSIDDVKKINFAYFFFLIFQVISDIFNRTDLQNASRGAANILVAILVFNFLVTLLNKSQYAIIYFLIGQILSLILFTPSNEGLSLEDMGFFKFRLAPILNNVVLIVAFLVIENRKNKGYFLFFLFLIYGLFCMAYDYRSNGMLMILTGTILTMNKFIIRFRRSNILLFSIFILSVFQFLYVFYVNEVISGEIGGKHSKEQLANLENPYNPINLLLSGRTEVYGATMAIKDKPFIGFGSWAEDKKGKYTKIILKLKGQLDKSSTTYNKQGRLIIPSHSVLFGAWVSAGLGAFICIFFIFFIFIKRGFYLLKSPYLYNNPILPIIIFFLLNGFWTFLFSPLPHIRQTLPIFVGLVVVIYGQIKEAFIMNSKNLSEQ
jgi:hypothetical protein